MGQSDDPFYLVDTTECASQARLFTQRAHFPRSHICNVRVFGKGAIDLYDALGSMQWASLRIHLLGTTKCAS